MQSTSTIETSKMLDAALANAARGWKVIPIPAGGKKPVLTAWPARATTDEKQIRSWFPAGSHHQLGLVFCRASNLIDIEGDDEAAETKLHELFDGNIPRTPTYRGKRGLHRLFRWSDDMPHAVGSDAKAVWKIGNLEFRIGGESPDGTAKGAQSLCPPSRHPSGVIYEWVISPDECEVATLPATFIEKLKKHEAQTKPKINRDVPQHTSIDRDKIIDRASKYVSKMPSAISGQGGQNATFHASCELFRFGLTHAEARGPFDDFNARCEPPWTEQDLERKLNEAHDTVTANGEFGCRLTNGVTHKQPKRETATGDDTSDTIDDEPDDDVADEWTAIREAKGRTDRANSRRFIKQFGDRVRFCHAWGKWLIWDGTRWKIDDVGAVMRLAMAIADSVWMDAKGFLTKDVVDFAVATSGHAKLNAMLKLAAADVPVSVDELDANRWLLNCLNGTVDLRTGELRQHRHEDNITKLCPTNFNPAAGSYHFERFLEGVFGGHQPTIDFIQRFFGYCLTGDVSEQILAVFYGIGSNGKSTLLKAIQDTLGTDFSAAAPPSLLMEKKTETHPTELAGLFGKRLVIAQETNAGARLAEATVKSLTGGDIISARRMREDFWQFSPTHKLILCTNHKPRVKGTDHAIWRRLVLILFGRKFWNPDKGETGPDELKQDKTLPAKLKAEAEGILAWMVQGCLDWQRTGLQIPESVRAATEVYRNESDTLGRFVAECCLVMPSLKVKFSCLFDELEKWCNESGDNLPTRTFVGQWLKDNGYQDKHSGARWYLGIALKAETTV